MGIDQGAGILLLLLLVVVVVVVVVFSVSSNPLLSRSSNFSVRLVFFRKKFHEIHEIHEFQVLQSLLGH